MRLFLTGGMVALAMAALAGPAAADSLDLGFSAPRGASDLDRAVQSGASVVRIDINWPAPRRPVHPTDPADPAYDFVRADSAIKDAAQRGLRTMLTITGAPKWAEGAHRPKLATAGSWRPDPVAFGRLGTALAKRYSGRYPDPQDPTRMLPRVAVLQAWNEPNLPGYLRPQWRRVHGRVVPASPAYYRRMLNAFYAGVARVAGHPKVAAAGTAPFGDLQPGGPRMPPVVFMKSLLSRTVHADVFDHHPYSVRAPFSRALNAGDVSVSDLGKLTKPLRAAQRAGRVLPRGGHQQFWVTEFAWDSSPPDPDGVPMRTVARWLAQSLYVFWRDGVHTALWFQVADQPPVPSYETTYQSGIYFADGRPKLLQRAYAFPFVALSRGRGRVLAWARAPAAGELVVERRAGAVWKPVASAQVRRGQVIARVVRAGSTTGFRARMGSTVSLES